MTDLERSAAMWWNSAVVPSMKQFIEEQVKAGASQVDIECAIQKSMLFVLRGINEAQFKRINKGKTPWQS